MFSLARRDAMDMLKDLEKEGMISQDEQSAGEKEVQKLIDSAIDPKPI